MARVPYLDEKDLKDADKDILKRPINLHRGLAHSVDGARAFGGIGAWIRYGAKLDPKLRELVILQVGWLARSPYEWSHHVKIGKDFGLTDADIEAVKLESAGKTTDLPPLYRAGLKGAREMANAGAMSAETYALIAADLDHERMVELVMVIAFYCGVVRLLASLGIDVEANYQSHLDAHPLPE
jgi:alkylhydroperoxidase family enzyme